LLQITTSGCIRETRNERRGIPPPQIHNKAEF
jgi:hypothetical protein